LSVGQQDDTPSYQVLSLDADADRCWLRPLAVSRQGSLVLRSLHQTQECGAECRPDNRNIARHKFSCSGTDIPAAVAVKTSFIRSIRGHDWKPLPSAVSSPSRPKAGDRTPRTDIEDLAGSRSLVELWQMQASSVRPMARVASRLHKPDLIVRCRSSTRQGARARRNGTHQSHQTSAGR